ncbi:hypothetical protein ONS95_009100 [Cadophora gregata]|uniref:uncharacterized protein n=1 Tax=Cadophora gregata TaxID=51156 RepID=UPI0026DB00E2|nr:uncharacterized protein ONS95_009100 [Cadophora gregata]KAK0124117.1 hypothetical protein ONS95_009100 [Cadophora gregata]KAK0130448.1 hypothetical protein ONS96_000967 [Cadophora gregata f. sp. sojae]
MASDEERSLKGRAGKPKVRTGCKTCKRRKVKCDEGKPGCLRCLKFGTECEGYRPKRSGQQAKATKGTTAHRKRLLLPNDSQLILRRASEPIPHSPQQPLAASQLKGGLEDQQYLGIKNTTEEDSSLWDFGEEVLHNIPWDHRQSDLPHTEPTIQQLNDSIAALSKAKNLERAGDMSGLASAHFNYAFRQYGRALEGIREIASSPSETHPTKLLLHASVLIFIFESIQDNSMVAITHLKSAYNALVTRDPSLKEFELAKIIEEINEQSSLNEIFLQLKDLQIQSNVPPIVVGFVRSSFG